MKLFLLCLLCFCIGGIFGMLCMAIFAAQKRDDDEDICSNIVTAEAESPSPKPTDPLPIRGVEYVPTEVDVKTGTVTYELRQKSENK